MLKRLGKTYMCCWVWHLDATMHKSTWRRTYVRNSATWKTQVLAPRMQQCVKEESLQNSKKISAVCDNRRRNFYPEVKIDVPNLDVVSSYQAHTVCSSLCYVVCIIRVTRLPKRHPWRHRVLCGVVTWRRQNHCCVLGAVLRSLFKMLMFVQRLHLKFPQEMIFCRGKFLYGVSFFLHCSRFWQIYWFGFAVNGSESDLFTTEWKQTQNTNRVNLDYKFLITVSICGKTHGKTWSFRFGSKPSLAFFFLILIFLEHFIWTLSFNLQL